MKPSKLLPYATDNHEFTISWDKTKATVVCKFENEAEAFENPIKLDEFKEMIFTAANKGVKRIDFNSNYSIEVQRTQWAEIAKKYGIKLTRISN
jgi:hypothetical protein